MTWSMSSRSCSMCVIMRIPAPRSRQRSSWLRKIQVGVLVESLVGLVEQDEIGAVQLGQHHVEFLPGAAREARGHDAAARPPAEQGREPASRPPGLPGSHATGGPEETEVFVRGQQRGDPAQSRGVTDARDPRVTPVMTRNQHDCEKGTGDARSIPTSPRQTAPVPSRGRAQRGAYNPQSCRPRPVDHGQ